jgi:hypothetical protein
MFLLWEGFVNRFMQIYKDLKATAMVECKLQELI